MLDAFGRMATMIAPQTRGALACNILRCYMQSDKPCDIATCMYYTGIDPFTRQQVYVAKGLRDRKMQRALMQFFKPDNWFIVREALIQAERQDLIGNGCDCLIPAQPPKEAIEVRRRQANDADHYHTVANPAKGEKPGERGLPNQGYRPGRKGARRQEKRRNEKKRKTDGFGLGP